MQEETALPRKELKGTETQAGFRWRMLKAGEGKGGREEGKEEVQAQLVKQASTQQCLCQEPAFLKPWARGAALQEEGSPGAGTGKLKEEPSASKVSCHAALGCRQRERGQRLGAGGELSQLVCVFVCRKHTSLQAACSKLCLLHPLQRSSCPLILAAKAWHYVLLSEKLAISWEGDGLCLGTQLSIGGRGLKHKEE